MKKFIIVEVTGVSITEQGELIEYLSDGFWKFKVELENEE